MVECKTVYFLYSVNFSLVSYESKLADFCVGSGEDGAKKSLGPKGYLVWDEELFSLRFVAK